MLFALHQYGIRITQSFASPGDILICTIKSDLEEILATWKTDKENTRRDYRCDLFIDCQTGSFHEHCQLKSTCHFYRTRRQIKPFRKRMLWRCGRKLRKQSSKPDKKQYNFEVQRHTPPRSPPRPHRQSNFCLETCIASECEEDGTNQTSEAYF